MEKEGPVGGSVPDLSAIAPDLIADELVKSEGNVVRAAKALGVRPSHLRKYAKSRPGLMEASLEAAELAIDKAEQALLRAMRKGQLSTRLQAAAFIVRSRRRGR